MHSVILKIMAALLVCVLPAFGNTITLPGIYQMSPSDVITLNSANPERAISYSVGVFAGNEISFRVRYLNLNALNMAFGDTVNSGTFRIYHGNNLIQEVDEITSGEFSELSISVGELVRNGSLELRLVLNENSDPVAFYKPWLYITDDIIPGTTSDLSVTQSYRRGLKLEWTAAGDDGNVGIAALYEIRYSKWPVEGDTAQWWGYAEQAMDIPYPSSPGSHESFVINGLDTVSTYNFILVTYDEIGNRSYFSDVAIGITGQGEPGPTGNYCLEFNSINTRAVIPNTEILNPSESITIEAWVNCHELHRWTQGFIVSKNWPEYIYPFLEYSLAVNNGNSIYAWFTTEDGVGHKMDTGLIPLLENRWTHLSWTYDGHTYKTYVDGELSQVSAVSGPIINWDVDIYLGILEYLDGWGLDGYLDELRIWNVARTQDQLQQTMNQRLNGNESGLIGYWSFDEGEGQQFFDATSYGSNGYLGSSRDVDDNDAAWVASSVPIEGYAVGTDQDLTSSLPENFEILQNYPNPFNGETKITFKLPKQSYVRLEVYDMLGRRVRTLADGNFEAGAHDTIWKGKSDSGESLSSGIYFYRLKTDALDKTKKMLMLK